MREHYGMSLSSVYFIFPGLSPPFKTIHEICHRPRIEQYPYSLMTICALQDVHACKAVTLNRSRSVYFSLVFRFFVPFAHFIIYFLS